MPPEIQRITDQFLHNPVRVEVAKPATTADTITQRIVELPGKDDKTKRNVLRKIIGHDDVRNGIIFCNRKSTVDIVAKSLQKHGFNARPIHGDLAQAFRMETLDKFRTDEIQFLVASDVAARGLDIPNVSHVFNYDVPIHSDDYVHRIGRTGRAGKTGAALMLVTPADRKAYDAILKTIGAEGIPALDLSSFIEEVQGERKKRPARKDKTKRSPVEKETKDTDTECRSVSNQDSSEKAPPPRRKRGGKSSQRESQAEPVVGLGDHMPAFLTRAVSN